MSSLMRLGSLGAVLALPWLFAACTDTATRTAPVTTTTAEGQSSAPSAAAADRRDTALVRVVHAVPDASSVDVYADDTPVVADLDFKGVSPYKEVDGQRYTFSLRQTGNAERELARNSEGLDDGDFYTVFAVPSDGAGSAPQLRVVEDDHSRPAEGKARVRVVHASPGLDELDVYIASRDDEIFGGVDFRSVSDYDEVEPFTGPLEVRAEGGRAPLLTIPGARFDAGKSYTIVIVSSGRRNAKPDAFLIEDEAPALPTATSR